MSMHLTVVAAYLPKELVNNTQKLVLMKICDAVDDQTMKGRPGLERMMAWAGVGEKRVATVVTELVELGLVERSEVARRGNRAEYHVFPHGIWQIPSTEELKQRRRAARQAPKNPNLARRITGRAKPSAAARTREDAAGRASGTGGGEPHGAAGFPPGNPLEEPGAGSRGEPSGFPRGNQMGSPGETAPSCPSPSSFSTYPSPTADQAVADADEAAGGVGSPCPAHQVPAANCRGCGTNPRRRRERALVHSQQEWFREFLAEQERRVAESDPQAVARARDHALSLARKGRQLPQKSPES